MIRKLIGALVLVEVARLSARAVYRAGVGVGVFANETTAVREFLAGLGDLDELEDTTAAVVTAGLS